MTRPYVTDLAPRRDARTVSVGGPGWLAGRIPDHRRKNWGVSKNADFPTRYEWELNSEKHLVRADFLADEVRNAGYLARAYDRIPWEALRKGTRLIVVVDRYAAGAFLRERAAGHYYDIDSWRTPEGWLVGTVSRNDEDIDVLTGNDETVPYRLALSYPPREVPVLVITRHGASVMTKTVRSGRSKTRSNREGGRNKKNRRSSSPNAPLSKRDRAA